MENNENMNNQVNENKVQEEKKSNNKAIGIIILVIGLLLVGFAGYKLFIEKTEPDKPKDDSIQEQENNNSNQTENSITSKINPELKEAISFAIKDQDKLVALTTNGSDVLIYDFSKSNMEYNGNKLMFQQSVLGELNFDYDVSENNLYLFLNTKSDKYIALIDLKKGNGNYVPEIISKVDLTNTELSGGEGFGGGAYITKIENSLYFSNKYLFKYDLINKKMENLNISSNGRTMKILKYNNMIIYNDKNDIYILDLSNMKSTKVVSNGYPAYIYDNSLIYYYEGENTGSDKVNKDTDESYYSYNLITSKKQHISKYLGMGDIYKEFVIPFSDGLYSFSKLELYKYSDKLELVHKFTCDDFNGIISECTNDKINVINNFVKISDNEILLKLGNEYDGEIYNVMYNINTKKISTVSNREVDQYNMEYYLK